MSFSNITTITKMALPKNTNYSYKSDSDNTTDGLMVHPIDMNKIKRHNMNIDKIAKITLKRSNTNTPFPFKEYTNK